MGLAEAEIAPEGGADVEVSGWWAKLRGADSDAILRRLLLGSDERQHTYRLLLLGAALLGLGLRIFGYGLRPPTLWQDEAYWAIKAVKTAAIDAQIRPLGFMLVTQGLLHLVEPAAWVYRLLPFLGSLVSMALAPYVALRLFRGRAAQLLSVLLLALSPVALEMAIEFKHYGVEIGIYVTLLAACLHHRERRSARSLALLLGLSWCSFFFSITVIFLYPALFGWLVLTACQGRNWRRLAAAVGVAVVCLATITTIYFTTWRTIKSGKAESKWGKWYDVFYVEKGLKNHHQSRLSWSVAKYGDLAAVPGAGRDAWKSERIAPAQVEVIKGVDRGVWILLHVAGIAYLVTRKRGLELALLWAPLWFVTAFNWAGRWPAGAFRTNTFYVPFAILLACFAAEWLADLGNRPRRMAPLIAGLLLLPIVYFMPGIGVKTLWAKPGNFTAAMKLLPRQPAKSERTLIMDFESCRPWDYYTEHDKPFRKRGAALGGAYRERCKREARKLAAEMERVATPRRGFWMLLSDPRKYEYAEARARALCKDVDVSWAGDKTHMVLRCSRRK